MIHSLIHYLRYQGETNRVIVMIKLNNRYKTLNTASAEEIIVLTSTMSITVLIITDVFSHKWAGYSERGIPAHLAWGHCEYFSCNKKLEKAFPRRRQ